MKKLLIALLLMPMIVMAAELTEGDTLYVNRNWEKRSPADAEYIGIVKRVDRESNSALVHYFSRENDRLKSIQHCVAEGKGAGLRKGKQIFFHDDGKVEYMEIYTLVHDERRDTMRNRLASEIYLYTDGKTKEEVNLTYTINKYGMETSFYTRKRYYPSGQLQYEESTSEKETEPQIRYYNEKGKKVRRPKQKIEPYMQMPAFPGGQEALFMFLSKNVKYPVYAQEKGIQGRVIVQFVVAINGAIENVKVVRSGGDPSLDKEAIRVVSIMPKWHPGKRRGIPVRVKYTVPVNFRLE